MTAGDELHSELRAIREDLTGDHATRIHRAISWLRCAEERSEKDEDIAFISLWISFNACYAVNDDRLDHRFWSDFESFVAKLVVLDSNQTLYNLLWFNYSNFVRALIDNKWVFEPFWQAQRDGSTDWESLFEVSRKRALRSLADNDLPVLLSVVMERLYTLRNQLIHGGATWKSSVNREQVRDGRRLLGEIMPIVIGLMMHEQDWGNIHYPVLN